MLYILDKKYANVFRDTLNLPKSSLKPQAVRNCPSCGFSLSLFVYTAKCFLKMSGSGFNPVENTTDIDRTSVERHSIDVDRF